MEQKHVGRWLLFLLVGLGIGAGAGVTIGWFYPLQAAEAGIADLNDEYKAEYTVMVASAYAENGDWDLVQERLGRLEEDDPSAYVVALAEQYIADGQNAQDIRHLVRVAARFGFTTQAMEPFFPATESGS